MLRFEHARVGFDEGPADALGTVVLAVTDAEATLRRAVDCGHRIEDEAFHLGGVYFRVQGEPAG